MPKIEARVSHQIGENVIETWTPTLYVEGRGELSLWLPASEDECREYVDIFNAIVPARISALESLARKLAKGIVAVRDLMAESGGVYGLHLNGDPSPWHELVEGGSFEVWLIDYSAAETALTNPIVSELIGMKEEGE